MPRFPICSTILSLWLNFCSYFSFPRACCVNTLIHHPIFYNPSKNFTSYEALHHEIHSFFLLLRNKYPARHPVYAKVSYCYRTPDNIRNECFSSTGLKKGVCRDETLHLLQVKEILTEMVFTKQCPLLLLVNAGCRQVGILESEKGEEMGCGLSWVRSRWNTLMSHRVCFLAVGFYGEGCITVKCL